MAVFNKPNTNTPISNGVEADPGMDHSPVKMNSLPVNPAKGGMPVNES